MPTTPGRRRPLNINVNLNFPIFCLTIIAVTWLATR